MNERWPINRYRLSAIFYLLSADFCDPLTPTSDLLILTSELRRAPPLPELLFRFSFFSFQFSFRIFRQKNPLSAISYRLTSAIR